MQITNKLPRSLLRPTLDANVASVSHVAESRRRKSTQHHHHLPKQNLPRRQSASACSSLSVPHDLEPTASPLRRPPQSDLSVHHRHREDRSESIEGRTARLPKCRRKQRERILRKAPQLLSLSLPNQRLHHNQGDILLSPVMRAVTRCASTSSPAAMTSLISGCRSLHAIETG